MKLCVVFNRLGDDRLERDRLLAQLDLAACQAGDIQQVVEQMRCGIAPEAASV
jgi:hypothetical protein